ncbi:MAG: hypothetical protein LBL45_08540 [Treponema sp.]|jgi:predicted nucleic acid-binding protein|nr:hypothetical protein [Treponema sp.]
MKYLIDIDILNKIKKKWKFKTENYRNEIVKLLDSFQSLVNDSYISIVAIENIKRLSNIDSQYYDLVKDLFKGRILPITTDIIDIWTDIVRQSDAPVMNVMIAATSIYHNYILVTDNIKGFEGLKNLKIYNPLIDLDKYEIEEEMNINDIFLETDKNFYRKTVHGRIVNPNWNNDVDLTMNELDIIVNDYLEYGIGKDSFYLNNIIKPLME